MRAGGGGGGSGAGNFVREISRFELAAQFPTQNPGPRHWHPWLSSTAPAKPHTPQHLWERPQHFPHKIWGLPRKFPQRNLPPRI